MSEKNMEIPKSIQNEPVDSDHPRVREFMFMVHETKGESLYGMFIGDWVMDEVEDEGVKTELRYGLCSKLFKDLSVHFILFCQIKAEKRSVILDEGKCSIAKYPTIWTRFVEEYKEQFGADYGHRFWRFADMPVDRRESLFNSMITLEM